MKFRYNIFTKLAIMLSFKNELTAEEMLENYIREQRPLTLLERIKAIRQDSNFIPVYNAPKAYEDETVSYEENGELKPISSKVITSQPRPIDFGNDIKAWRKILSIEHKKEIKRKLKDKEREIARKEFVQNAIAPAFMQSMMRRY